MAYEAALRSEPVHELQHLSFFGAALLFWWPVVNPAPQLRPLAYSLRLAYLVAAVTLTMLPVMIITLFVDRVLYPHYAAHPPLWGLTALDDQVLGWALMAVFGTFVYGAAILILFGRMALREERITRLGEAIEHRAEPPG